MEKDKKMFRGMLKWISCYSVNLYDMSFESLLPIYGSEVCRKTYSVRMFHLKYDFTRFDKIKLRDGFTTIRKFHKVDIAKGE